MNKVTELEDLRDKYASDVWVRYTLPHWRERGWTGMEEEGDLPQGAIVLVRYLSDVTP